MKYRSMKVPHLTIGFDLSDKTGHLFALRFDDVVVADQEVSLTRRALLSRFKKFAAARVVIEAGPQSQWVSEALAELGHEVIVANPSALGGAKNRRKSDPIDAEALARKGRSDPKELRPIQHRSSAAQVDLCLIRARDCLVRTRARMISAVRSLLKTFGRRLPSASTPAFAKKVRLAIPPELKPAVDPLLDSIADLSLRITAYDKQIEKLCREKYPETSRLTQVGGVGELTALAYVLTLEDPRRFQKSRAAGAFVGLVPALGESGDQTPQLKISKAGDSYLRRLLVGSAQYILGHFGEDCDLRRHGEAIAARGANSAKKRAAVAVARKLAVLLHRLWASGDEYDPFYNSRRKGRAA